MGILGAVEEWRVHAGGKGGGEEKSVLEDVLILLILERMCVCLSLACLSLSLYRQTVSSQPQELISSWKLAHTLIVR